MSEKIAENKSLVNGWVCLGNETPYHIETVSTRNFGDTDFFHIHTLFVVEVADWRTSHLVPNMVQRKKYFFRWFENALAFTVRFMKNQPYHEPCVTSLRPITQEEYELLCQVEERLASEDGKGWYFLSDEMVDAMPESYFVDWEYHIK